MSPPAIRPANFTRRTASLTRKFTRSGRLDLLVLHHLLRLSDFAREGIELTQHYVAPVCSPTRTGLMTGRCWSRFGVTSPQNERALRWDTITLPRALKARGYDTCLTGKWHLGSLPDAARLHIDPDPDNEAAIRTYEKAGFRRAGEIETPDGRCLYMILEPGRATLTG